MTTAESWRDLEAQFREHVERGSNLAAYVFLETDYQARLARLRAYGLDLENDPDTPVVQMESYRQQAMQIEAEGRAWRHPVGNWLLSIDSPHTPVSGELRTLFRSLAERAAICAGVVPQGATSDAALYEWLHLIRSHLPHQVWMDHMIENVWRSSALLCHVFQTAALSASPPTPSEAIERYRTEAGFSIDELAKRTGITARTVHKHLAGEQIRLNHTRAYADVFSEVLQRPIRPPEFQTPAYPRRRRNRSVRMHRKVSKKSP